MRNSYNMQKRQARVGSPRAFFQTAKEPTRVTVNSGSSGSALRGLPHVIDGLNTGRIERQGSQRQSATDLVRWFLRTGLTTPHQIFSHCVLPASFSMFHPTFLPTATDLHVNRLLLSFGLNWASFSSTDAHGKSAQTLLHILLCVFCWGWRVTSLLTPRWFSLACAMAFARLYDIAKQYGLVALPSHSNVSSSDASYAGLVSTQQATSASVQAPFAATVACAGKRARSLALSKRPQSMILEPSSHSGLTWGTGMAVVPQLWNLAQRIQSIDVEDVSGGRQMDTERGLIDAKKTIEELVDRIQDLERTRDDDKERLEADILDMQLKYEFLQAEDEDMKRVGLDVRQQVKEVQGAMKLMQARVEERDETIKRLLFDVATLFRDNETLVDKGRALEGMLGNAKKIIEEKEKELMELKCAMPDQRLLGKELAKLQNQQLDSCIFAQQDDSEDSIIIVTDAEVSRNQEEQVVATSREAVTPSLSVIQFEAPIPVFTTPRPSLPQKKPKLKPLILAARFTASVSSRRLHRKRSNVSLRETTPAQAEKKSTKTQHLNPKAPEFKPRSIALGTAITSETSKVNGTKNQNQESQKRVVDVTPLAITKKRLPNTPSALEGSENISATPRTTRAASVKLIRSRVASRTSKMQMKDNAMEVRDNMDTLDNGLAGAGCIVPTVQSVKEGLSAFLTPCPSRTVLGDLGSLINV